MFENQKSNPLEYYIWLVKWGGKHLSYSTMILILYCLSSFSVLIFCKNCLSSDIEILNTRVIAFLRPNMKIPILLHNIKSVLFGLSDTHLGNNDNITPSLKFHPFRISRILYILSLARSSIQIWGHIVSIPL